MVPLTPTQIIGTLTQPAALCYAAGYGAGIVALWGMARRRQFPPDLLIGLSLAGIFGGLIGAGLAQAIVGGSVGKSVLGGILGGWLAVEGYKRRVKLRRPTGDLFAVALMAGEAVGRWGCFVGGCCYGTPSSVTWAVHQHDAYRHPTQIYLSLSCATILAILLWCDRRIKLPPNGLWALQGSLYCTARFVIEFFRDHTLGPTPGPLSSAQWACIVGLIFFTSYFVRLHRRQQGAVVVPA